MTEETKKKISSALKGKKHSAEHTKNISIALTGRKLSLQNKKNIGLAKLGQIPWNKGISFNVGHPVTKETREKLKRINTGRHYMSPEARAKVSRFWKGKKHSPQHIEKQRVAMLRKWKDPKYAKSVWDATHREPNDIELHLLTLLEELYPNEWAYVGDGKLIIDGKCPDFVNINGKKQLIELYGDFWHKNHNPQDRIDFFKRFGYDTLIIYASELKKDVSKVLSRLKTFNQLRGVSSG